MRGLSCGRSLEAYKGEKTMAEIGTKYGDQPNMVPRWKHDPLPGTTNDY